MIKKQIARFGLQSIRDMNMTDTVQLTQKGSVVAVTAFTAGAQSSVRKAATPHWPSEPMLTLQRHFPREDPAGGRRDSINKSFHTH